MKKSVKRDRLLIRIMKISVVQMAMWILFAEMSLASVGRAQDFLNKSITIQAQEAQLSRVLKTIEKQADVRFVYSSRAIKAERKVTLSTREQKLSEVLAKILEPLKISYRILDGQIILNPSSATLPEVPAQLLNLDPVQRLEAAIEVRGKVTDDKGEGLPGVNVLVKGTRQGAATDPQGIYSVSVPDQNAVLVFSFVGYTGQEVVVGSRTTIDVVLQVDNKALEEVVVVGYGSQKKVNLTGAVSQVTSERIANRPVTNVDQALQGVSPGLNITTNTSLGGEPNAKMGVNIRGVGSLSGGAPWVLVDGAPMEMNMINPADVESISILKDAASTAIYGSRAAYGVILITTKSGKTNERMKTTYSNNLSWAQPTYLPGFVNSLRFANTINEAATNSGQNAIFAQSTIDRIIQYQKDPVNTPSMVPDPRDPNGWGYWNLGNANTDWWDVLFKDFSFSQRHNLGINGGGKNASYYVGLGWLDEDGKFNFANEKFQRYNLSANISLKVTDKITVFVKSKFNRSYQNYFKSQDATDRTAIFSSLAIQWPTDPVYTPNGDFAMDKNQPPVLANGGSDKQYITDIWMSPSVEFKLTKDWKVNADISYNYFGSKRADHRAIIWGLATNGITPIKHYSQNWNRMSQVMMHNEYMTSNIYSEYARQLRNHYFSVLVGGQAEISNSMTLSGWRRDLVTESVPAISTAIGDKDVLDNMSHWSTLGTFMRVSYNFNEKYLVEVNGRYDGSSRFQRGRRWGFFPSASVGYNIWKENFWKPVENILNTFKIRASYGALGNQNVANYLHEETIPIRTNLPWIMDGIRPVYTNAPSNRSLGLTWETSKTANIGFDAEALNNRLGVTFELYNRVTQNMFGPGESLPAVYGAAVPLKNNATLKTKGVELAVTWKEAINPDFNYNLNLIFSDNKSIVTKYNNPTKYIGNFYEGQVYGEMWGYETAGLFQAGENASDWANQSQLYSIWGPGDVKYKDLNNDGIISRGKETVDDHGDLKIIGNTTPRYMFGLNAGLQYKSFDFSMFWQGVGKRDLWMGSQVFFGFRTAWTATVIQAHALDYWSPENTDAYFAKPYLTAENNKNQQMQTRYLQDASYVRLKNMQIGYTVPKLLIDKLKIEKIRFYVSGENLFTFSKIMDSFDPETNVRGPNSTLVYPLSRNYSAGVNITF